MGAGTCSTIGSAALPSTSTVTVSPALIAPDWLMFQLAPPSTVVVTEPLAVVTRTSTPGEALPQISNRLLLTRRSILVKSPSVAACVLVAGPPGAS